MIPPEAYVAALAGFERMTITRLAALVEPHAPADAFAIAVGDVAPPPQWAAAFERDPTLAATWREQGRHRTPEAVWDDCTSFGIRVVLPTHDEYPPALLDDPRRPAALFVRGDLAALDARRVGIVGTRNATQRGRAIAARFGHELAAVGVTVVSGLALGIDGAAHRGALSVEEARPVAVVGNGLDVAYPKRHAALWDQVAARGALISEWPPGTPPDAFRFPLRNRILAALVEVLVVVESRERGGSLITAREAIERGVDVLAVPGALDNRAALGTNLLLRDGAAPVTEVADVLVALGLDARRAGRRRFDNRPALGPAERTLVDACRMRPCSLEMLCEVAATPLVDTALALARLERSGWLRETAGWFEALDEWADLA